MNLGRDKFRFLIFGQLFWGMSFFLPNDAGARTDEDSKKDLSPRDQGSKKSWQLVLRLSKLLGKIKQKPLNQRELFLLKLTGSISLGAVVLSLIIFPINHKFSQLNRTIREKEYLYQKYSRLLAKGETLNLVYQRYKDLFKSNQRSEDITVVLFEEISQITQESGISLVKVKTQSREKTQQYQRVSLEVELVGRFDSFFTFVQKIEESPVFLKIDALRLVPQVNNSEVLTGRCTISLFVFS